jgi:hypothetical protein
VVIVGEETTDDEDSAALRYEEKLACGGFESSFEELPDELERTVVQKFGIKAWLNRCLQQSLWFTSKYRNDLKNFYIFTDEDRKEVCIINMYINMSPLDLYYLLTYLGKLQCYTMDECC